MSRKRTVARDDIGADSRDERVRLQMRIQELEHDKRRLEIRCLGLQSEVDDLKRERACLQAAVQHQKGEHDEQT
jgi:hypothetical protein